MQRAITIAHPREHGAVVEPDNAHVTKGREESDVVWPLADELVQEVARLVVRADDLGDKQCDRDCKDPVAECLEPIRVGEANMGKRWNIGRHRAAHTLLSVVPHYSELLTLRPDQQLTNGYVVGLCYGVEDGVGDVLGCQDLGLRPIKAALPRYRLACRLMFNGLRELCCDGAWLDISDAYAVFEGFFAKTVGDRPDRELGPAIDGTPP